MGMAASQARFLQLTARKTNLEYMGQQLNQERLALANESAGLFERQLTIAPPVPPSSLDDKYYSPAYTFDDPVDGIQKKFIPTYSAAGDITGATLQYNQYLPDGSFNVASVTLEDSAADATAGAPYRSDIVDATNALDIGDDLAYDALSGRLESLTMSIWNADLATPAAESHTVSLTYSPEFDDAEFNDDMNKYQYQKATYDYEIERINLETQRIQKQDKSLELKMKQIDTEYKAITTEMDAVQKVIQKGIDSTFKTFS